MTRDPRQVTPTFRKATRLALVVLLGPAVPSLSAQTTDRVDRDRIDITGRQNLTLGSGARAYGMGGAFLARADDATAASWNPAGLSYLRVPELSFVGVANSVDQTRGLGDDAFRGKSVDFAAVTWPIEVGGTRGAVQLSYQRAVTFDGRREIHEYEGTQLRVVDDIHSSGGFDVLALGSGVRLTRTLRAGFTANRWINGYDQDLSRRVLNDPTKRHGPVRDFHLAFRPQGWNFNLGLMWSPLESLNVGTVYKTAFRADVDIEKSRSDSWILDEGTEITTNAAVGRGVQLDLPSSYGFGLSWRPYDTLTLAADFTRTRWSAAQIYDYFDLLVTQPSNDGVPSPKPSPLLYPVRQYPGLGAVPTNDAPDDPLRAAGQRDKDEYRFGIEWVVIKGGLKIPLRAGYFNDRQITPDLSGNAPHFDGFTAGAGLILGPVLLDVAYLYEFGSYYAAADAVLGSALDVQRNAVTTRRAFASVIYRFSGRH